MSHAAVSRDCMAMGYLSDASRGDQSAKPEARQCCSGVPEFSCNVESLNVDRKPVQAMFPH